MKNICQLRNLLRQIIREVKVLNSPLYSSPNPHQPRDQAVVVWAVEDRVPAEPSHRRLPDSSCIGRWAYHSMRPGIFHCSFQEKNHGTDYLIR